MWARSAWDPPPLLDQMRSFRGWFYTRFHLFETFVTWGIVLGTSANDLKKCYTETPIFDEEAIQANIEAYNALDSLVRDTFYFKNVTFDALSEAVLSVTSNAQGVDSIQRGGTGRVAKAQG